MRWQLLALIGWGLCAAVYDARRRRLPNLLTLGGAAAALLWLLATGQGLSGVGWASCLGAAAFALLLLLPAYAKGWLGGGDVKLGVALGLAGGTHLLLITLVFGGTLLAGMATGTLLNRPAGAPPAPHRSLPFGTAYGLGFAVAAALFPLVTGATF